MNFLADVGVSMTTVNLLRGSGEAVVHLREEGLHRLADDEILEKARREQRVVLTFDLDFGDLLAASGDTTPSVILFRMRNQTPAAVTPKLFRVLDACRAELERGAMKSTTAPADDAQKNVSDYRHPEATRKNNPPAKIAAEGYVPLIPNAEYLRSAKTIEG